MLGGVCVSTWWCGRLSPLNMSSLCQTKQSISKTSPSLSCLTNPTPHPPLSAIATTSPCCYHPPSICLTFTFSFKYYLFDALLQIHIFLCHLSICHSSPLAHLFRYVSVTCPSSFINKKMHYVPEEVIFYSTWQHLSLRCMDSKGERCITFTCYRLLRSQSTLTLKVNLKHCG